MSAYDPLVTIVTATYNHAAYLRKTIESVLAQTYEKIEYIVINDGSPDETEEILRSYGGRFMWETQPNMGEVATLNRAFSKARGELIGKLSSDDRLYPQAVEQLVRGISARPDAVVAFGDFDLIDHDGKFIRRIYKPDFDPVKAVRDHICYPGTGHLVRRSIFENLGGFDPQFRILLDMDFWWRAGLEGDFVHIPEPLSGFRVHDESQSSRGGERMARESTKLVKKFYDQPGLPGEFKRVRAKAFSSAWYAASQQAKLGRSSLWRSYFIRSFLTNPIHLFKLYGIGLTMKQWFDLAFLRTGKKEQE